MSCGGDLRNVIGGDVDDPATREAQLVGKRVRIQCVIVGSLFEEYFATITAKNSLSDEDEALHAISHASHSCLILSRRMYVMRP